MSHCSVALMLTIPFEANLDSLDESVSPSCVNVGDLANADDHAELACSAARSTSAGSASDYL